MNAAKEYELATEALLLEQWLRFCFLVESGTADNTGLKLDVPEPRRAEAARVRPALLPLLDRLNGREPDARLACEAVTETLETLLGSHRTAQMLDDPVFHRRAAELQEAIRVRAVELDETVSFAEWLNLFSRVEASVVEPATGSPS